MICEESKAFQALRLWNSFVTGVLRPRGCGVAVVFLQLWMVSHCSEFILDVSFLRLLLGHRLRVYNCKDEWFLVLW